jgi:hypothetical protein
LPESFFSVEDDIAGRMFLYKHFNLKAIVALPNHAFSATYSNNFNKFACLLAKKTKEARNLKFNELMGKTFRPSLMNKLNKVLKEFTAFNIKQM